MQGYVSKYEEPSRWGSQTEKDRYSTMFSKVTNSTNKGFYLGRFESGSGSGKAKASSKRGVVPQIVAWNSDANVKNLEGGAYANAWSFTSDKSYANIIRSTLVYGCMWDTALAFIGDESYLKSGKGRGWHEDNYKTGNPKHLTGVNVDSKESNRLKNIYDMARKH